MIDRENYKKARLYMDYLTGTLQNTPDTVRHRWGELKHLLLWADKTPFSEARRIDPSFQTYLETARNDGKDIPLSPASLGKTCQVARRFFTWLHGNDPKGYKELTPSWIDTIKPSKRKLQSEVFIHEFYSFEEIKAIAALDVSNDLFLRSSQAAAAFLYLSGMRAAAFLSLPVSCVDIKKRRVSQLPSMGVLTKNRKAAITSLLDIKDLLNICAAWDEFVKGAGGVLWYPRLESNFYRDEEGSIGSSVFMSKDQGIRSVNGRRAALVDGLKRLCIMAGIAYKSPHKFRHGHVIYGMKRARNIAQLKAVSQNVMHGSLSITDGIYGGLSADDIGRSLADLENNQGEAGGPAGMLALLKSLQDNPDVLNMLIERSK